MQIINIHNRAYIYNSISGMLFLPEIQDAANNITVCIHVGYLQAGEDPDTAQFLDTKDQILKIRIQSS